MELEEIRNDDMIKDWLEQINAKPTTRHIYTIAMMHFCEYANKSPVNMIDEAEQEIREGKLMRSRSIKKLLPGFRKHLQDSGKAPKSVKNYLSAVRSYYSSYDIEVPTMGRNESKTKPLEKNLDIPNKDDVIEVLKAVGPLERAVVLVGVSSGMTTNEIIRLTVGQFKKGYDPETGITTLRVRREKAQVDFYTFLTPEASQAVQEYLNYRNRPAKKNTKEKLLSLEKQRVTNDIDRLFIEHKIDDDYLQTRDDDLRAFTSASFTKMYRRISANAGKCTPVGDWNIIRAHNFRKYFNSALLNAGADSFFVEYLMGHTLDDTRSAYFRATPEKLREIYMQFVPFLTIQKELDISESIEYQQIKKENQVLQAETARHIVERAELASFKEQMEENEKRMKLLTEMVERLAKVN